MIKYARIALSLSIVFLAACATPQNEQEMNSLASALTKVSAAVDATVRYKRSADDLEDAQLLQASVAHDPALLKPFDTQRIRVLRVELDSSVLVCDANSEIALLEDVGCTPQLDANRWRDAPQVGCVFTLDLKKVCTR
ncbi:hypothetical protein N5K37_30270 [Delftia tsuruhatensis]|uniref:Lipoprotein n=1 Tax=Delftia tsuruhatensis TaxID=180282 RepID=A0AAX3SUB2_9BURK|nr:hypothetical protein [Delftia tsuruhatensis]MDH2234208.1 hypothetical protein [Delftia tsuruhatensis]WFF83663.1 hypothetical protein PYR84_13490 [Delftia tsuruhatensis]